MTSYYGLETEPLSVSHRHPTDHPGRAAIKLNDMTGYRPHTVMQSAGNAAFQLTTYEDNAFHRFSPFDVTAKSTLYSATNYPVTNLTYPSQTLGPVHRYIDDNKLDGSTIMHGGMQVAGSGQDMGSMMGYYGRGHFGAAVMAAATPPGLPIYPWMRSMGAGKHSASLILGELSRILRKTGCFCLSVPGDQCIYKNAIWSALL
jgi:hypothetical protein